MSGAAAVEDRVAKRQKNDGKKIVPITVLSGFLGAGKTTLLKHLLENKQGLKVGLVVNDVAELNIDAALVSTKRQSGSSSEGVDTSEDTVQLDNGCACCSSSDELMESIQQLLRLAEERREPWDHIVIELSGVAEPNEVRQNFRTCMEETPELIMGAELRTVVTVIDSSVFMEEFHKRNTVEAREDLGSDDLTDGDRQVVDLMCEQIESADVLIFNKTDLVTDTHLDLVRATVASLNGDATMHTSERGRVELTCVLAASQARAVACESKEDDLRLAVEKLQHHQAQAQQQQQQHKHKHSHHHQEKGGDNRQQHHHNHDHKDDKHDDKGQHHHSHEDKHHHQHDHGHHHHGHHGHDHDHHHDHDHDHDHEKPEAREAKRFGITSFVYQRRRPFHPRRLKKVIKQLPAKGQDPLLEILKTSGRKLVEEENETEASYTGGPSPMSKLIRSKGFVWISTHPTSMLYWAQAGKHFELTQHANWYSGTPKEEWPTDEKSLTALMKDFGEYYFDNRQELVFIGVKMDQAAITKILDGALLTDMELIFYKQMLADRYAVHDDLVWQRSQALHRLAATQRMLRSGQPALEPWTTKAVKR